MPTTFKAIVYADNKRQDGTYNIKIRVTHNRRTLKVSTNLYAAPEDLTRGLKIKNQEYIDKTDDIIKRWRKIVTQLNDSADNMDVKQVVEHIKYVEAMGDQFKLDFIEYGRGVAASKSEGTRATYETSLNALSRFVKGRPLDINKITARFLTDFEKFLENEPAYLETQNCFDDEGLEKVLKHAEKHGKVVGGWLNEENGKFYYDSIRIFHSLESALTFGRENEQIAIFDLNNLRLIKL